MYVLIRTNREHHTLIRVGIREKSFSGNHSLW